MSGFKSLFNGDPWTFVLLLFFVHAVSPGWLPQLREASLTESVSDMFGVGITCLYYENIFWQDLSVFDFFKSLFQKKRKT